MAATSYGQGFSRNDNAVHYNHNYGKDQNVNYGRDQYINNGGQISHNYHTTIASRELLATSLYIVRPNPPRYSIS